ncbi:MAG: bidirectional hydrogenase complex protein HoxU [Syntrophobacteraceae bacterium]
MSVVTLTINDRLVSAPREATLLDVIQEQGIDVPTLCHLKGLSERGGCRLCVVEIVGSPRLAASCVTPVAEGMVVQTHTAKLLKYRQQMIELLLTERNHICAVCVQNGNCELQTLAAKLGVTSVRYDYLCPDLPMDASHERYVMDHNRCVLCSRCNRVCDEVEGAHTLDMAGRGIHSRVITGMNQPWGTSRSCTGCGKCVQVCPTGALFKKGSSAAEMRKQHDFLLWIMDGREKKIWRWS